jgi:DNA-binding NarL/FixJ family response regulator
MSAFLDEAPVANWGRQADASARRQADASAVLLDKHPLVLETLVRVLDGIDVEVTSTHTESEPALDAVESEQPDLFLIGFERGDDADGIACVREAFARVPAIKPVALVDSTNQVAVAEIVSAGATVVLRTAPVEDFAIAVRQTLRRSIYLASTHELAAFNRQAADLCPPALTKRELEILRLVAEGYSNGRVARTLWVTEQTVKFHLSNTYKKLNVANRTEASRWAQRHGLLNETRGDAS